MSNDSQPVERRRNRRVPGPFRGRRCGTVAAEIHLRDLSVGGCLIESLQDLSPGSRLRLEIDLPGEGPVTVEAQALYQLAGHGVAVKFVEVGQEALAALERCLARW